MMQNVARDAAKAEFSAFMTQVIQQQTIEQHIDAVSFEKLLKDPAMAAQYRAEQENITAAAKGKLTVTRVLISIGDEVVSNELIDRIRPDVQRHFPTVEAYLAEARGENAIPSVFLTNRAKDFVADAAVTDTQKWIAAQLEDGAQSVTGFQTKSLGLRLNPEAVIPGVSRSLSGGYYVIKPIWTLLAQEIEKAVLAQAPIGASA